MSRRAIVLDAVVRRRGTARRRKPLWWLSVVFTVLILAVITMWVFREKAPVLELMEARIAWNAARDRAGAWSADLNLAAVLLDSSQASLDRQFARIALFRRFGATRALISAARDSTLAGGMRAEFRRRLHRDGLAVRMDEVAGALAGTRSLLEVMETNREALSAVTSAEVHLAAVRGLLDLESPDEVERMLNQAEADIGRSTGYLIRRLDKFLLRRAAWNDLSSELRRISGNTESPVVLVDKLNRTCFVLRRGAVCDSFPIEMGPNWMSRKLYSGDKATPEGRYKVVELKTGPRTIYYKAALLDYPNAEDRERYGRARAAGLVPEGTGIGNLIQIHGKGGRGSDWTLGCVGLEDTDMDRLMSYLRVGTPVYIVGFWRPPLWLVHLERGGPGADPDQRAEAASSRRGVGSR